MEHGIIELNKLLDKMKSLGADDYIEIYNESLSRDQVKVFDDSIETNLSYSSSQFTGEFFIFSGAAISYSFDEEDINQDITTNISSAA